MGKAEKGQRLAFPRHAHYGAVTGWLRLDLDVLSSGLSALPHRNHVTLSKLCNCSGSCLWEVYLFCRLIWGTIEIAIHLA